MSRVSYVRLSHCVTRLAEHHYCSAGSRQLNNMTFDCVIIDEAAQALEAVCWIPILKSSKKLILAGDHLQLPPTIKSSNEELPPALKKDKKSSPQTLEVTLFDRLLKAYGKDVKRLLNVQYRMHEKVNSLLHLSREEAKRQFRRSWSSHHKSCTTSSL
jgi:DNA polymerase alpha-associated DNA helicase A